MGNKGIMIVGSPASGKSTFVNELYKDIDSKVFGYVNQDVFVEDPKSDCYNNPLKASKVVYDHVLPLIFKLGDNFLLDTVGSNTKTLRKIIDNTQYQFKVIIVYCNPIIAFKRNFSRERRLPKQVLLERWLQVYSQIDEYINMFGEDNIYVHETEYTEEEYEIIEREYSVRTSLEDCQVESTFRKDETNYTVEQLLSKENKFITLLNEIDDKLPIIEIKLSSLVIDNKTIKEKIAEWI